MTDRRTSDAPVPPQPRSREIRRATRAASVGNFVEWYDFALYGLLATTLSTVFFPSANPTTALLSLFAVFGAAFLVRPLGALVFGPLGDRLGRQRILVIVITGMSASTFLVGVLPARAGAGGWVTVALVVLRLVQGFSSGGEIGGANTFLGEYAEPGRRAYRVSFISTTSLIAIAFASALAFVLQTVLSQQAMLAWGWRVPFLVAGVLGLVGLYIRLRLEDTPEFRTLAADDQVASSPLKEVLGRDVRGVLQSIGLVCMLFAAQYVVTVYMATYFVRVLHVPLATATFSTVVTVLVAAVLAPVFGILCDRWGRRPVLLGGCVAFAVLSYPMFAILQHGAVVTVVLVHLLSGVLLATLLAPSNVLMIELFATRVRYSGASIGYNIGAAAFGGTAPYVAAALVAAVGRIAPAFVLIVAALITIVTCLTVPETRRVTTPDLVGRADRMRA